MSKLYEFDAAIRKQYKIIAGVDEAGRGPLAGPVVAAAIILPENFKSSFIDDSKKLSPKKREEAFFLLKENALSFAVSCVSPKKIDEINILNAAMLAMKNAIKKLNISPDIVLVDGNKSPQSNYLEKTVIKGDQLSLSIASASIIAKYIRDKIMEGYAKIYPEYKFNKHKGYPTKEHKELIKKYGACKIHRKSFKW